MHPRRLNVRFLALIMGLGVLLGAGAYLVHRHQLERTARVLLREADGALAKGGNAQAAQALERYLAIRPRDLDALARYGLVLDRLATNPRVRLQAFLTLEEVLRRDPRRNDLRRRLVDIAMSLGRYSEARTQLEILGKSTLQDRALDDLRGQCEEALGAYSAAATWYEKAIAHEPQRREVYLRLAALQRTRLQAPDRADRVLDALVAANPDSARALLDRAAYRRRFHLPGAAADLQQARRQAPDDPDVLLEVARSARDSTEFQTARQVLQRGLALAPREPRFAAALAELEVADGHPDEAIAALRGGLERLSDQGVLLWSLAELLAHRGDTIELPDLIQRLRAMGTAAGPVDYLDACLQYNRGDWAGARTRFERAQRALDSWPALKCQSDYLLGQCYGRLGDTDLQFAAFRRAATLDPSWVPARLALAGALAVQGKPDQAIEEYRVVLPRAPEARPLLVRLLIQRNLRLPAEQRTWDEIDLLIAEAARDVPDAIEPSLLRAEALVARDRSDDARNLLEATRDRHPGQVEPHLALARLLAQQRQWEPALAVLDAAGRQLGDRASLRLERARIEAARGGAKAAPIVEEQAHDLDRFESDERRMLLGGLAMECLQIGASEPARRLCRALAEQEPSDLGVRLSLLDLALQAGDESESRRLRDDYRRIEGGDGPFQRYVEARHLIWRAGQGDKTAPRMARTILNTLASRRPDWLLIPLALAELDEIENDLEGAIKAYLRAIDLGERDPQVLRRAARLLLTRRRYAEADRLLRLLPESQLLVDNLLLTAANVAMKAADHPRALDLSRKAVAAHPADFRDHLSFGQALWVAGRPGEAEAELRRAVALAGAVPDARVALISLLARTGRSHEAEAEIRAAERALPEEQRASVLAQCYAALGQLDRAQVLYQEVLAADPDNLAAQRSLAAVLLRQGALPEAEARLRALNDRKEQGPEDAAWVRRTLAMVLTLEGSYPRVREALTLVDHGDDPDDRRALARVLVALRSPAQARRAIQILEQLAEHEPLTDDDQFLLAQLYEADGAWLKARERWQGLLAAQPANTVYLAQFAELTRRHGRTDEAKLLADRLERLDPKAFRTVEIKARVLADLGCGAEATALVKASAQGPEAVIGAAALLEELGQLDEAEALRRRAVEIATVPASQAEALLDLAEFLGRRDRTGEALDLCERAWKEGRPDAVAVARACVNVLAAARGDDPATGRVACWLEQAVARDEPAAPAGLLASLAAVRELQGRYGEAESLYRTAIARDVRDAVPLNNLAWLIALKDGSGRAALGLINQAIERAGPEPELLDTRAVIYLTTGQSDRALADLDEAIAASPTASKYFHRAQAHLRAGHRVEALRDLTRMNQTMDRESRRQIAQEETFRAAGHQPSPLKALQELERTQGGVKVGTR
jgi:tetratricopeptide (TPR) repeat protein